MFEEDLPELIDLYLQEKCSTTQKEQVEQWFEAYKASEGTFYNGDLQRISAAKRRSWSALKKKINKPQVTVKKLWYKKFAAAAILLITLSTAILVYRQLQPGTENFYANDIPPGKNKAILTLADGSTRALDGSLPGNIASQAGINISKTANGALLYHNKAGNTTDTGPVYNTISIPPGGTYQVVLPDGTRVWLNAASSLKFPVNFSRLKERRVILTGEGYFEVAKLAKNPFIVLAGQQEVRVLGTHFNISCYADDEAIKTTLLEGSVNINRKAILKPGQQAINTAGSLYITKADTTMAVAWKNGKFSFQHEHIKSLMRKLARWYDVDVVYEGQMTNKDFSGSVSRFDHISKTLDVLQATNTVHFKVEGRRITVMP